MYGSSIQSISRDRVKASFERKELRYMTDQDGDFVLLFGDLQANFIFYGESNEMLQIRGSKDIDLQGKSLDVALRVVNDWNKRKLLGKAYVFISENTGKCWVHVEETYDFEEGCTDGQLDYHIGSLIRVCLKGVEEICEAI